MALTEPEKTFCVLEFARCESVGSVQSSFRVEYHKDPPFYNIIMKWCRKLGEDGCLCDGEVSGRPGMSENKVEEVREAFQHNPSKLTRRASQELNIPHQMLRKSIRKRLRMKPYKLLQAVIPTDKNFSRHFAMECKNVIPYGKRDFPSNQ